MNPFVDTQKRSVELPFGCKDLAEVLTATHREPHSKERWRLLNGLSETEHYLTRLLLTPASVSCLDISLPNTPHHLLLIPIQDELCILLFIDGIDKGRLSRIRKLFCDAGISPSVDVMGSFSVISATSTRILTYPLPSVAPDAADLIIRVIREGFAISEETQLYISCTEKSIA